MKSTVEQLSPTRVKITIEVPFEELKPEFDSVFKTLASQVNVPGFRPGKAPAMLIETRVGRGAVLDQVINDAIPTRYSKAVADNNLVVLTQPDIELTELTDGERVEFTAEVDVRPEITVPKGTDIAVEVPELPATDDAVATELDNLRARFGTLTSVQREAKQGDFLSIDLKATVDGKDVDEAATEGLSYEVGSDTLIAGLDDAVTGLKEGESADFNSALMAGEHAGKDAVITVTVNSVKERELPEADDDFAQLASEFDTLEELKADLATGVSERLRATQAEQIRDAVLDALIKAADFEVPQKVVDEEAHQQVHAIFGEAAHNDDTIAAMLQAQGIDRETFDKDNRDGAEKAVRTQLLLDQAAQDFEVTADQNEIMQHIAFQAQRLGVDPNQYVAHIAQNNQVHALYADVRRSKALATLILEATVTDSAGNRVDTEAYFGAALDEDDSDDDEFNGEDAAGEVTGAAAGKPSDDEDDK